MPEQHPPITEATTGAASNGCPSLRSYEYPVEGGGSQDWWPNRLNLLAAQNPAPSLTRWVRRSLCPRGRDIDVDADAGHQ